MPSKYEESEWTCSTYGKETCSISHANITKGDKFYIGVRCYNACRFSMFPQLTNEVELDDGVEMQLDFNAQETKLFKFKVPKNYGKDG
jgi:hypothetical protein